MNLFIDDSIFVFCCFEVELVLTTLEFSYKHNNHEYVLMHKCFFRYGEIFFFNIYIYTLE